MIKKEVTFRHINKIAVPALLASIAEPLLSSTDAAVVGNLDTNATEALACIQNSQNAGFENITIDLIYGTPTMKILGLDRCC